MYKGGGGTYCRKICLLYAVCELKVNSCPLQKQALKVLGVEFLFPLMLHCNETFNNEQCVVESLTHTPLELYAVLSLN